MLPFTEIAGINPTATVEEVWYRHPTSIRCLCGITMYGRVKQTSTYHLTRFECSDYKCQKCIIFIDNFNKIVDNVSATQSSSEG